MVFVCWDLNCQMLIENFIISLTKVNITAKRVELKFRIPNKEKLLEEWLRYLLKNILNKM